MPSSPRGLGRGLGALLKDMDETPKDISGVESIPVSDIVPNPHQPRQTFSEKSLQELAQSIQSQGVLQPILIRPGRNEGKYELIAGERRLRATTIAGLDRIPAIVRAISDEESTIIALIENLQREDLNPLEESLALHSLKKQLGISQEELALRVGKSRPAIANALRLLSLPHSVQSDIQSGLISPGHARAILTVQGDDVRIQMAGLIKKREMTVRQAEKLAKYWKEHGTLTRKKPASAKPSTDREFVTSLHENLDTRFSCPVTIKGSSDKGSITLSYDSHEQLRSILQKMGLDGA